MWIPGIADHDITDGHIDFTRFARPGVVTSGLRPRRELVDRDEVSPLAHLDILSDARDARDREPEIFVLEAPTTIRPAFDREEFAAT
ncbi:MAG: agmatine deiminase family protein [Burkholderiaceae bacterium]